MKTFLLLTICLICLHRKTTFAQTYEYLPLFSYEQANFSDWVQKKIKYPKKAKESQITGKVDVQYTVTLDCRIDKIQILSDSPEILNSEVIRILNKSPRWERAGLGNNKYVEHTDMLTVHFAPDKITVIPTCSRPTFQGKHFTGFASWVTSQLNDFGRIAVYFAVTKEGKLENIRITECTPANIRERLMEIILSSPTWQPATKQGKPVRSSENIVIHKRTSSRIVLGAPYQL